MAAKQAKSFWCCILTEVTSKEGTYLTNYSINCNRTDFGLPRANNRLQSAFEQIDASALDKEVLIPITRLKTFNHQQTSQVVEAVTYHDIFTITDTTLREINVEAIIRKDMQALAKVRRELNQYAEKIDERHAGLVNEFNWNKIKDLEFRENLAQKEVLFKKILACQCNKCPDLKPHVSFLISSFY